MIDKKIYPDDYIGLLKETALEIAENRGVQGRIICEDGKYPMVTRDHRLDRVNLTVVKGIVTEARVG